MSIEEELLKALLEDSVDVLQEWEQTCLELSKGSSPNGYENLLRCAHNLKGSAGLAGREDFRQQLHAIEDFLVYLRDSKILPSDDLVALLLQIEDHLQKWVEKLKTDPNGHVNGQSLVGELQLFLTKAPEEQTTKASPAQKEVSAVVKSEKFGQKASTADMRAGETLRVSAQRLDRLIQLTGELSLYQAVIERGKKENNLDSQSVHTAIDLSRKLIRDLQESALTLRMVPVQGLFQKLERIIYDLSFKLKKPVQVVRQGESVALDKLVIERISDPLTHIVRNAMDHGIEAAEQRVSLGKKSEASILLSASNEASGVVIRISDDGGGINPDRVYTKAIEKGVASEGTPLSHKEKLHLIFVPGFSTASEVTEISGRGVGLDVVWDVVNKLGGRVEIETAQDKGTSFVISLPTNLSVLDAMVIKVNGCQYAVPSQDLAEVVDFSNYQIQTSRGGKDRRINLRGKAVPVEELKNYLITQEKKELSQSNLAVSRHPGIVVRHMEEKIAFYVDELVGQQQIFARPLEGHLHQIPYVSGATVLSDGEPSMILNLPEIARKFFHHAG